jgi:hypothetical protein
MQITLLALFSCKAFRNCRSGGSAILFRVCADQPFGPQVVIQRGWPMSVMRAAVVSATILSASSILSTVAAQEADADVAYVEALRGRVVAFARGAPGLINSLDVISDRTRFDLLGESELRLCHYGLRRFVTMRGPARITVSADAIKVEAGRPVQVSQETCSVVRASNFQGGIVARGVPSEK